jgi:hypothetical protein
MHACTECILAATALATAALASRQCSRNRSSDPEVGSLELFIEHDFTVAASYKLLGPGGPKALTGFTFGNYSSSSSGVFAAAGD